MKTHTRLLAFCLLAIGVIIFPATRRGWTNNHEILFSKARIIIEFNETAQDVGVQVFLDGEPWKTVSVFSPKGTKILNILGQRSLSKQGLTELFFESSEPSLANLPLEQFFARFPAGEYEFEGVTVEGKAIEGEAILTHVIPEGPSIITPASTTDDPPVVDPANFVIAWEPVTETITVSEDLQIAGYQVIVEQVEPRRVYSVDLPASTHSVMVPPEFFAQRDTLHKFEVLAIESGGNQTITEGEFVTER